MVKAFVTICLKNVIDIFFLFYHIKIFENLSYQKHATAVLSSPCEKGIVLCYLCSS